MTFSLASSCVFVPNELWPFKCLKVTVDSLQSEKTFSVSKLSHDGPSILMRSRVYSPNLVCSTTFLSVHARKTTLTKGSIATIVIISSQTVTTLISSTLRQTNSSIVHINYWSLPRIFSQNNGQCFFDIT